MIKNMMIILKAISESFCHWQDCIFRLLIGPQFQMMDAHAITQSGGGYLLPREDRRCLII
jgi:hypothetical protein